jgi:hypothetical protein
VVLAALDVQGGVGDGDGEVLGGFVRADHLAHFDADRPGAGELASLDAGQEGGEEFLGGGQQVLAGAGAVGGQHRVAAGDQPLAGEVLGGDLGQVLLIEETELEGPVLGHQLLDRRGAQRGDPPVGVRLRRPVLLLVQSPDPGGGDHAAVPDHDHFPQPELRPHHVCDGGERGRVAGAAGEHPDRDRAACRVGEQPVLDLQLAFLAVPGVAACGQRAAPALQLRGRQVEQRHLRRVDLRRQVAAGQPGLDRVLLAAQRGVVPPGQGGQLGTWLDHTGDDQGQGQGQVPVAARGAEQGGQAQLLGHGVHGSDMS